MSPLAVDSVEFNVSINTAYLGNESFQTTTKHNNQEKIQKKSHKVVLVLNMKTHT